MMKRIWLSSLLRQPDKVKRLTRAGQSVQVTDHGKPLWVIQPAGILKDETERVRAIDDLLEEVLRLPRSKVSISEILEQERR